MKNLKNLFLVIMLVSCFAFSASAQTAGSITLVHVDGLYAPDTIEVGKPITFHFRLQNNFGEAITGFSNGFRIYSPSEAIWDTADAAFTGAITPAMMDFGTFLSLRNVDGIGEDTIGFGGVSNFGTGIPDQFNDTVWSITIGPIAGSEHLKEICIDSSFYSPSNIWLWVLNSGNVIPDWGGPYCFTIYNPSPTTNPPILDSIGPKSVDENLNLNFAVTASDADGTAPQLTASGLPAGALFIDNGDGTGFFDWTPDFTQAGTYFVTFYASDATDVDSEVVTITVNGVNAPPVIGAIGDKTVNEGDILTFNVSASDPDGGNPFISMSSPDLPPEATFQASLIAVGVYKFNWPTDFSDAGVYTAIFTANDGNGGIDEDTISITVNNVTCPDLVVISLTLDGPQEASLGRPIGYRLHATVQNIGDTVSGVITAGFFISADTVIAPPDSILSGGVVSIGPILPGDTISLVIDSLMPITSVPSAFLPAFVFLGLNLDYTGDLAECNEQNNTDWIPIKVDNNLEPILDSIGDKTVNEGELLSFTVTAFDWDLDFLELFFFAELLSDSFFTDNGDGTGTFNWTPGFSEAGTYLVEFDVSDGQIPGFVFEELTITVNNANAPPTFDSLSDTLIFDEGDSVSFFVSATDLNFEHFCLSIVLTSPDLPLDSISFQNAGECGEFMEFSWLTDFTDSGTYTANFTVTDDSGGVDTDSVVIIVNNVNRPPVQITGGENSIFEGETLFLSSQASDPDNDSLVISISSDIPAAASIFVDHGNGGSSLFWQTSFFDAGTYTAIFTASDGNGGTAEDTISITVFNVNQPPVITPTNDTTIDEGQLLELSFSGFDPDSDNVFFSASGLPTGALFTDNTNGNASLSWTPTFLQAGTYDVTIILFEPTESSARDTFTVTVNEVNVLPQINLLPDSLAFNEGDSITFFVNSTDFEDFCPILQMTSPDLPAAAVFSNSNSECGESGDFDWQTNFDDAGIYRAIFTSTDDSGGVGTDSVIIIVNNVNRPPVLDSIGNKNVQENQLLSFNVSASDPDEDILAFSTSTLPPGADFFSSNGGWAFVWTPDFTQSGNYSVTFFVSDGLATDSEVVSITVLNVNQQPVLNPINDTMIVEGDTLVLSLSGFDPDGTQVFFDVSGEPLGSELVDNGDGTALFNWTPTFDDAGIYDFVFFLYGVGKEGTSDSIRIIVENFNRLPSFVNLPDTVEVNELDFVQFKVNATDPDEDCLFLSMTSPDLPESALFFYGEDCLYNGLFEWETTYDDAGIYQAIFAVEDEFLGQAEDTVIIIINNKNQPPRFDFNEGEGTNEGTNLNFLVSATDGDSTIPFLSVLGELPIGAQFTVHGDGSGTFDWTPDFNQSGQDSAVFLATDDSLAADTLTVLILISEAGDAVLTVKNATCVQCSPPQNFTDIIVTEPSFSIEFNNQIISASLEGNINFTSTSGQTFDYFYDEYSKLLYVFPFSESEPFQPADTITVFLSTGIIDLSGSPLDSNYSLIYFTGPVVFPGDADNNGVVDERDILSLGLYWNLTGPSRDSSTNSLQFAPSPGHFQVLSKKWEPNVAAYADADGSGTVNADDICGVSFNFGLSNQPSQKINGDMPAMKQLDNSVMQQLYNALIECPNSAGKTHLVEFLEDAINSQSVVLPTEVELYQNYPNPFNPSTMIEFYLPEQQYVTLDIYNILGQRVVSLVDREMDAGFQSVSWSGRDNSGSEVASGIYFYLLKTDDRKISKRMMMLK